MNIKATTRRRSSRKRLVCQSPRLTIDGDVPYRQGWASGVPPDPGVYLIRDMRGLLYVGRSNNLRSRFHQHLEFSHNKLLRLALNSPWGQVRFAWILDPEPKQLEEQLIRLLMPICNERGCRDDVTAALTTN
jgi:excinuclease UvrABC nuclease subunit